MKKLRKDIINEVIDRLKDYLDFQKDGQLAEFLEMSPSNLTNWRIRGTIDIFLIMDKCNISLDYLLRGEMLTTGIDKEKSELYKEIVRLKEDNLSLTVSNSQLEVINRALVNEIRRLEKEKGEIKK